MPSPSGHRALLRLTGADVVAIVDKNAVAANAAAQKYGARGIGFAQAEVPKAGPRR